MSAAAEILRTLIVLLWSISPAIAHAADVPSGLQITPDSQQVMINKDVQQPDGTLERWAITYDRSRGTFLGNVFRATGGEPAYVSCTALPPPDGEHLAFRCLGADKCTSPACPDSHDWTVIADEQNPFTVPSSFFEPRALGPSATSITIADGAAATGANIPSGFQITPDPQGIRMINKDVQQLDGTFERWAITYDPTHVRFLGNVFRATGGDPAYIFCTALSVGPINTAFECLGADKCTTASCPADDDWTVIADHSNPFVVPNTFFEPRAPTGGVQPLPGSYVFDRAGCLAVDFAHPSDTSRMVVVFAADCHRTDVIPVNDGGFLHRHGEIGGTHCPTDGYIIAGLFETPRRATGLITYVFDCHIVRQESFVAELPTVSISGSQRLLP